MKNYFLSLLLVGLSIELCAQSTTKIDSNYLRPYYEQRVSLFKVLPKVKNAIIFIGNSITDGGEWQELLGCKKCLNRGSSGDISFGVNARLEDVLQDKPKKIFLLIGINDLSRGIPNELIIQNYTAFISRTKQLSPKTQIYLQSILPVNATFRKFTENIEENIKILNQAMDNLAQNVDGVTFIDLHSKFIDAEGKLDKKYTNDGLHLLGEGYMLWAKIIKQGRYLN